MCKLTINSMHGELLRDLDEITSSDERDGALLLQLLESLNHLDRGTLYKRWQRGFGPVSETSYILLIE